VGLAEEKGGCWEERGSGHEGIQWGKPWKEQENDEEDSVFVTRSWESDLGGLSHLGCVR
jgi:hypothetical protein